MTVIVQRFDEDNPLTYEALNANLQALVSAINAIAGDDVLQLGVVVDDSPQYMPKTGGTFTGQIVAPSMLIGSDAVVTRATTAEAALRGVVLAAAALADFAGTFSSPPTQAECNALKTAHNTLLARLRASGALLT